MSAFPTPNAATSARSQVRKTGKLAAIRRFFADFRVLAFSTYRPEQHYMRGPGPACAAKRATSTIPKNGNRFSDQIVLK